MEEAPLSLPQSRRSGNPQTGEQLYQRGSCTVAKVLGPTKISQPGEPAKALRTPKETDSWRVQLNLVHQDPEKGLVTPRETEPHLSVSVRESLVEVWVDSALLRIRGTKYNSPGNQSMLASVLLKEVTMNTITATIVWPQAILQVGNTAPPIRRKLY